MGPREHRYHGFTGLTPITLYSFSNNTPKTLMKIEGLYLLCETTREDKGLKKEGSHTWTTDPNSVGGLPFRLS